MAMSLAGYDVEFGFAVAAADPDETEQPSEDDWRTCIVHALRALSKTDSLVKEAARLGDLNKVAAADPDETDKPEQLREDVSAEADVASPSSEETSFTPLVEEPSTAPKTAKAKQKVKKVRATKRTATADGEKAEEEDSLVEAAGRGDLERVQDFLAKCYNPNQLESGKETSCFAPEPSAIRRLAEESRRKGRARTDGKTPGTTALIAAAVSGHSNVAWELLLFRADVNATDSDGLTALSAASCSTACDIHMWFLLHRAASQTQNNISQSSSKENTGCLSRMLWDRNHAEEETRILLMLVTLLLGQGPDFTEMVDGLLKKVDMAKLRWEKLTEPIHTVLCDYAWDRERVQRFVENEEMKLFVEKDQLKAEEVDAFALRWHSTQRQLFVLREVQVRLHRIPLAAPLACTPSVLQALEQTQNEETLQTDAVEVITAAAWLQLRLPIVVDICLNCVAVGCLCLVTLACRYGGMHAQLVPQQVCPSSQLPMIVIPPIAELALNARELTDPPLVTFRSTTQVCRKL
ncbi:unnamed protein product [Symbiodinium sp. CCMP2592]|nr:unnamed protein product [Symbiodinium sp. CCMP2592]